jgi:hypothetical protein
MVYDVKSQRVTDYCIDGYNTDGYPGWSPDSTQILVKEYIGVGGLLVDLPTNRSFKLIDIPNVIYPSGWMRSFSNKAP